MYVSTRHIHRLHNDALEQLAGLLSVQPGEALPPELLSPVDTPARGLRTFRSVPVKHKKGGGRDAAGK